MLTNLIRFRYPFLLVILIPSFFLLSSFLENNPPSEKTGVVFDDALLSHRVDSVLSLMTLEEKIGQLVQYSSYDALTGPGAKDGETLNKHNRIKEGQVGSLLNVISAKSTMEAQKLAVENSRLGIPMIFGYDVIHGFKTMFPVPLGESASWDIEAIEASARVAAKEAASAGIHWTFAPMVDVTRDARWGRVMEGGGEDPYLQSRIAEARVRGFQGDNLADPLTVAACAKHFAGYGFAEAGRDYNTVDVSRHTLYNTILPPFKACVDAGVATFMTSFNEIGGVPSTGNKPLLRNVLKEGWDFDGFIVSDWGSIDEMIPHGFATNQEHASQLALEAGCDMDMEGYCYERQLSALVREGIIAESHLDDAVRRILAVKFRIGIMDNPYLYSDENREKENIYTPENRAIARDVARKSIVLLKNENKLLPLNEDLKSIAVIGPLAKDKDTPLGNWRGQAVSNSAVSLYEGLEEVTKGKISLSYAMGCSLSIGPRTFADELEINETDRSGFPEAIDIAREADLVILALGEDSQQTGEGRSQVNIGLAGLQQELMEEILKVNPNIVVVLMNGRPLELSWMDQHVPAIVEAWHLGTEAGHAISDVLFGKFNPSGKLPMCFPRDVGQLPLYYAQKNTGRPGPKDEVFWSHYTDEKNDALYPFGFGLSYTSFAYSKPVIENPKVTSGKEVKIRVKVKNTGQVAGAEVVQLYLRDISASYTRPVKELKGFSKIELKPGEEKEVHFTLDSDDLSYYSPEGKVLLEPGHFKAFVGSSSVDLQELDFELTNEN